MGFFIIFATCIHFRLGLRLINKTNLEHET